MRNIRVFLFGVFLFGVLLTAGLSLAGPCAGAETEATATAKGETSPGLVLSANALDFGNQAIKVTSAPQALTLTNAGKTAITIKKVFSTSSDFDVSQNCKTHLPLPAGESCTMMVFFTPQEAGARQGTIAVLTADAHTLELALRGNGAESEVALSDTHLVFHDQLVNTRSGVQVMRIENRSETVPLTIKNMSVSEGFALLPTEDSCTTGKVAPRGSCNLAVSFTPRHEGQIDGTITIKDSDEASPHRVQLDGRATAVKLSVPSLIWDATAVNTAGNLQELQISNEGISPLRLENIAARGDFAVHHSCGKELASHQACMVRVTFQPKSVGKLAGALMIRDSDVTTIQTVFLAGSGAALGLTPEKLEFGEQNVGASSPLQTIVLANHGESEVNLRSLAVRGDFVMPWKSCGETLGAGQNCQVSLSFSPTGVGPRSGQLNIDTGTANLQSISLSGVGVEKPAEKASEQHLQAESHR